jgi:hypothetical protein
VDHLLLLYTAVLNLEDYPRGLLTRPSDKLLAPKFVCLSPQMSHMLPYRRALRNPDAHLCLGTGIYLVL